VSAPGRAPHRPSRGLAGSRLPWLVKRARRRAWQELCRRLYVDRSRNLLDSILVAGTARSGTTWIGSTIAAATRAREIFEPFNSRRVPEARPFGEFPYRRADESDEALVRFCTSLLTGRIRGPWVDRYVDRLRPRRRVIKAVRANQLLGWLHRTFPELPIILVIRHPCAVVLSRAEADWSPDEDIAALLSQPHLVEDHLGDVLDLIRSARSETAKRAVIWCAHYRIPIRQLRAGDVVEAWYEHLCREPETELRRALDRLGVGWTSGILRRAAQPSSKSLPSSAVVTGDDKVERWRRIMSPHEIDEVLTVVRGFGLGHLYDDSPMPLAGSLLNPREVG
jgi:hypothetical protein